MKVGLERKSLPGEIHSRGPRALKHLPQSTVRESQKRSLKLNYLGTSRVVSAGAFRDKPGRLEIADGGSIFLDEVGEMSLRMQGLLLRFLKRAKFRKLALRTSRHGEQRSGHCSN